jgi:hypothetical protein
MTAYSKVVRGTPCLPQRQTKLCEAERDVLGVVLLREKEVPQAALSSLALQVLHHGNLLVHRATTGLESRQLDRQTFIFDKVDHIGCSKVAQYPCRTVCEGELA